MRIPVASKEHAVNEVKPIPKHPLPVLDSIIATLFRGSTNRYRWYQELREAAYNEHQRTKNAPDLRSPRNKTVSEKSACEATKQHMKKDEQVKYMR